MTPPPQPGERVVGSWPVSLKGLSSDLETVSTNGGLRELGCLEHGQLRDLLERLLEAAEDSHRADAEVRVLVGASEYSLNAVRGRLYASVRGEPNRSHLPVSPDSFLALINGDTRPELPAEEPAPVPRKRGYRELRRNVPLAWALLCASAGVILATVLGSLGDPPLAGANDAEPIHDRGVLRSLADTYHGAWATGRGPGHRGIALRPDGQARLYEWVRPESPESSPWRETGGAAYRFGRSRGQQVAALTDLGKVGLADAAEVVYFGDAYARLEEGFDAPLATLRDRAD